MSQLWQALVRAVTGKSELPPDTGIPAGTDSAFRSLREQRLAADQQTRQLRMDPARAIRQARKMREELQ